MPQRGLFFKLLFIGILLIGFAVGLTIVKYIVYERQGYQQSVIREIESSQISTQHMVSPFIAVPYTENTPCDAQKFPELKGKLCSKTSEQLFFPQHAQWNADFNISDDTYQRTIYRATSYISQIRGVGQFDDFELIQREYNWKEAKFILPIKDLRGIHNKPILTINQKKYQLDFPTSKNNASRLDYLVSPLTDFTAQNFTFSLDLTLEGLQQFSLIPTTESTVFKATGNWSDAKYFGESLPQQKLSTTDGFNATWKNMTLGHKYRQSLINCWNENSCDNHYFSNQAAYSSTNGNYTSQSASGFTVQFIQTINIYSQTDRALKYGWIITLVSFGCFFLFEILKGLRIHPIQYLLVGVAQSVFFILLLSISEQFNFLLAYSIASISCIGLMSWYLSFALKEWKNILIFTGLLGSLYGVMYVLLQSAEKTFLMGSLFSFFIIAMVMFITRRVDWYQLSTQK